MFTAITIKELRTEFTGDIKSLKKSSREGRDELSRFTKGGTTGLGKLGLAFKSLGNAAKGFGNAMMSLGKMALRLPAMLGVAAGGISVALGVRKAITDFAELETKVAEVGTLLSKYDSSSFIEMKRQAQDLAIAFGQTTTALMGAKYDVVSAGFADAADSAEILTTSVKAATAGLVDAKTAANLIISGLRGYQLEARQASEVSDILFTTVRLGRTTFGELAQYLGSIMPTAKAAGVSLRELGAAIATVTLGGIDTATATTALNRMFLSLTAPTEQASEAMERLGIVTKDESGKLLKLQDIIEQFRGKKLSDIVELAGDMRSARAILALANNFDIFKSQLEEFNDTTGATESAFGKMSQTLTFQGRKLRAAWDAIFQNIGEAAFGGDESGKGVLTELISALDNARLFIENNKESIRKFATELKDNLLVKANELWDWVKEKKASGELEEWLGTIGTILTGLAKTIETIMTGLNELKKLTNKENRKEIREQFLPSSNEQANINREALKIQTQDIPVVNKVVEALDKAADKMQDTGPVEVHDPKDPGFFGRGYQNVDAVSNDFLDWLGIGDWFREKGVLGPRIPEYVPPKRAVEPSRGPTDPLQGYYDSDLDYERRNSQTKGQIVVNINASAVDKDLIENKLVPALDRHYRRDRARKPWEQR